MNHERGCARFAARASGQNLIPRVFSFGVERMLILGLSSLDHDMTAALLQDGSVVAAIENDKLTRSRTRGLPDDAIQFCLKKAGAEWHDLKGIAVASRPVHGWTRRSLLRARLSPYSAVASAYYEVNELGSLARELNLRRLLRRHHGPGANVVDFDHHLSHAASAFFLSPHQRALILVLDEDGDGTSGLLAVGEGSKIRTLRRIAFPHSPGWIYTQVTELLGFLPHKEEHKTQWLSLEGEPIFKDVFLEMMRRPGSPLPHLNRSYFNRGLTGRVAFSDKFYQRLGLSGRLQLATGLRGTGHGSYQALFEARRRAGSLPGRRPVPESAAGFQCRAEHRLEPRFRSARSRQCRMRGGCGLPDVARTAWPSAQSAG
jgi:hypothetical protein